MPEHYRALIVILVLACVVFALAKSPATQSAMLLGDFARRRNYWFYITIVGFLSPNFWIFAALISVLLLKAAKQEKNKVALFLFLLLALPQSSANIPGFGVIEYIFSIDYSKILVITLLLPVCLEIRKAERGKKIRFTAVDKILFIYCVLVILLKFRHDSATGIARASVYMLLDVLIPYYAFSRSIKTMSAFRDVLMSFVIAAMVASMLGIFEFAKGWLLYSTLADHWGVHSSSFYLLRSDLLRANVTSGHAIALGYVLAVAIGAFSFLKLGISSSLKWLAGLLLLIAGEISPLSKGPWVGAVALGLVFLMLSPARVSHAIKLLLLIPVIAIALLTTDQGKQAIEFLPFVGTVDEGSATYRQQLFDTGVQIVLDNPLIGSSDYLLRMENMRQGQGIIDLVNTYLIVALNNGLIGLSLFIMFFGLIIFNVYKMRSRVTQNLEIIRLGDCLIAIIIGILIMISTASPIFHIALVYFCFSALGVAYVRMTLNG